MQIKYIGVLKKTPFHYMTPKKLDYSLVQLSLV